MILFGRSKHGIGLSDFSAVVLAEGIQMSVSKSIQELEDKPADEPFDWIAFSARLNEEFSAATTSGERSDLLAARAVAMEFVVRQLELHGEQLEKFIDACELEYKRLIVRETLLDGVVSYEEMLHVTDREIAAGRMSEDYALRTIAIEECQQAADVHASNSKDAQSRSASRLAKLTRWLHID
jgi:hypothetical protein